MNKININDSIKYMDTAKLLAVCIKINTSLKIVNMGIVFANC